MQKRDYNLLGKSGAHAVEIGLTTAEWYHTQVGRKEMKQLMQRSDQPALRDTFLYYGLMVLTALMGILLWPSWWSAPFWAIYGVLYASGADSRWHECGHGTAFKTRWMNSFVYNVACFCLLRNPVLWRWAHARHHTDTIIVGRDPEIVSTRPPSLLRFVALFFGWEGILNLVKMFRHASTGLNLEEKSYVPESEWHKPVRVARIWSLIFLATGALAIVTGSLLPFMVIGGPILYGSWHFFLTGLLQHTGLADNVIDHRLNTRTVLMGPVQRFIYWNMNYHLEHHMFPMVPYHALPKLHALIKDDMPPPTPSFLVGLAEVFSAIRKQLTDPEYTIVRELPSTARPYRMDLHEQALGATAAE